MKENNIKKLYLLPSLLKMHIDFRLLIEEPMDGFKMFARSYAIREAVSMNKAPPTIRFPVIEPVITSTGHNELSQARDTYGFVRRSTDGVTVVHYMDFIPELARRGFTAEQDLIYLGRASESALIDLGLENVIYEAPTTDWYIWDKNLEKFRKIGGMAQSGNERSRLTHGSIILGEDALTYWQQVIDDPKLEQMLGAVNAFKEVNREELANRTLYYLTEKRGNTYHEDTFTDFENYLIDRLLAGPFNPNHKWHREVRGEARKGRACITTKDAFHKR